MTSGMVKTLNIGQSAAKFLLINCFLIETCSTTTKEMGLKRITNSNDGLRYSLNRYFL